MVKLIQWQNSWCWTFGIRWTTAEDSHRLIKTAGKWPAFRQSQKKNYHEFLNIVASNKKESLYPVDQGTWLCYKNPCVFFCSCLTKCQNNSNLNICFFCAFLAFIAIGPMRNILWFPAFEHQIPRNIYFASNVLFAGWTKRVLQKSSGSAKFLFNLILIKFRSWRVKNGTNGRQMR